MLIYRIEDKDNNGPYKSWELRYDLNLSHQDGFHPSLYRDIPEWNYQYDYICGFKDLNQYYNWFSIDWIQALNKDGFTLNVYDIHPDNILFGSKQICFKKNKNELIIKKLNPVTIEEIA